MHEHYEYRTLRVRPRSWPGVLAALRARAHAPPGGSLFALFTGQIGVPSDEGFALCVFPDGEPAPDAGGALVSGVADVVSSRGERLVATARPLQPAPPTQQGVYAHRWFEIDAADWSEFLELSEGAWPDFEAAYGASIVGLWRSRDAAPPRARVLLLTRYPSLAVWEQSRGGRDAGGSRLESFRRFARRHELTHSTFVVTTQLHAAAGPSGDQPDSE